MAPWDRDDEDRRSAVAVTLMMALLLVVGLAVGGGVVYLLGVREADPAPAADECDRRRTVELTVAPALADTITLALREAAPTCVWVRSTTRNSGDVALGVSMGGALPDIWIPESRSG